MAGTSLSSQNEMDCTSAPVDWAELPAPAWMLAFSFLQQLERLRCRLVCSSWRDLVNATIREAQPDSVKCMAKLNNFPALISLNMTNAKQATLEHVKPFTKLRCLHLPSSMGTIPPQSLQWLLNSPSCKPKHQHILPQTVPHAISPSQNPHFPSLQRLSCGPDLLPHIVPCPSTPFPHLTSLTCHHLQNDHHLLLLLPNLPLLNHLDLSLAYTLSSATLHQISLLPNLSSLTLSSIHRLPPSPLSLLTHLIRLTQLSLSTTPLDPQDMRQLSTFVSLLHLNLADTCERFPPFGLPALSHCTRLTHLNLSWCSLLPSQPADRQLLPSTLQALTNLQELLVEGCDRLSIPSVEALTQLRNLKRLDISQCDRMKSAAFNHLSQLTELTSLKMTWNKKVTDSVLLGLKHLRHLRHLDVARCTSISNEGLSVLLPHLTALTHLDVHRCPAISEAGLCKLSLLPHLAVLDISGYRAPLEAVWPTICSITGLCKLNLRHCPLLPSDSTLLSVSSLRNLTNLDLSGTPATPSTLRALSCAPILHTLLLHGCTSLTVRSFEALSAAGLLSVLDVSSTAVDLPALRYLLTHCSVSRVVISPTPGLPLGSDATLESEFPHARVIVSKGLADYQHWEP